ncbi:TPA: methionine adenosyltransferase domain-containing protein [Candidatus Woesearchaeota archaeon]|nr:MAG: hypothetical protein QT07_C0006G0018 [archaeon GW2011_AR16]HIG96233.1 methionine adenosyltransferase domain-containing protein [Candidatus Woesearchaeota archaeon]HIH47700.1 methionine adenosyltransferase domain-containing protein [Candidatus Woesearchaeota archaeon]HII88050.1 methionine adenosyltransferase domain-containing protein [Candidatus Woesearchaeota archaeon]
MVAGDLYAELEFPFHPDNTVKQIVAGILKELGHAVHQAYPSLPLYHIFAADLGGLAAYDDHDHQIHLSLGGQVRTPHDFLLRSHLDELINQALHTVLRDIDAEGQYRWDDFVVHHAITPQSSDIQHTLFDGELHWGDSAHVESYTVREEHLVPGTSQTSQKIIVNQLLAHEFHARIQTAMREKRGLLRELGLFPDGKLTTHFQWANHQSRLTHTSIARQHVEDLSPRAVREILYKHIFTEAVLGPVLYTQFCAMDEAGNIDVNTSEKFTKGGLYADFGVSKKGDFFQFGLPFAVQSEGLHGKDVTKAAVLLFAASHAMAHYVVDAGISPFCKVGLSSQMGKTTTRMHVETGRYLDDDRAYRALQKTFPLTPQGIVDWLGLDTPAIYGQLSLLARTANPHLPGYVWSRIEPGRRENLLREYAR